MNNVVKLYLAMLGRGILTLGLITINSSGQEINSKWEIEWSYQGSQTKNEQALKYQIDRFHFPEDKSKTALILVTINPIHFNRGDMIRIAADLNGMFAERDKLKAELIDNENIARLFLSGRMEIPEFLQAQRGRYSIDRTLCKESIQFSTKPGKPKNEVMIRIKCAKSQSSSRGKKF